MRAAGGADYHPGLPGEDRETPMRVNIDEEREVVKLLSMLQIYFPEERGAELAVAVCAANNSVHDGCFTYSVNTGRIFFGWAFCYTGCEPGPELFLYMAEHVHETVGNYREIFSSLVRDKLTLEQAVELAGNQLQFRETNTDGAVGKNADRAYAALCSAMERGDLSFRKYERIPVLRFRVEDEGPIQRFVIRLNRAYELITLNASLPIRVPEERRIEMAVAVCRATSVLLNGCFGYNLQEGTVFFRLTAPLRGCEYSEAYFACMVECATEIVSEFSDLLGKVAAGELSLPEFMNMT